MRCRNRRERKSRKEVRECRRLKTEENGQEKKKAEKKTAHGL